MIWFNAWGGSKTRAKGKADLALVAPTPEELAWWATQRRRHMLPYLVVIAGAWLVPPALSLLFPTHVPRRGWGHAIWMCGFMGTYFAWGRWHAVEPSVCANEIRGRRLRRALQASVAEVPVIADYRQPARLLEDAHHD